LCFAKKNSIFAPSNLTKMENHSINQCDKVLLIYTGGTIGMGQNPTTGALQPLDFEHLESQVQEFQYLKTDVDIYQFDPPIDSSDMSPECWSKLVQIISENYDKYAGFVILHGTDTMAYTASALSFMLENLTKPVILTGSQLPVGQLRTDGKENLITSVQLAAARNADGTPCVPEVCIYFSGKLLRGNRSTKQNAEGFNAFGSFNYPSLCEAGINFAWNRHYILKPDFSKPMLPHRDMKAGIVVLSMFPGIDEHNVRHVLNSPDLHSIVMRTYGSGNVPQFPWLIKLLRETTERGVTIVNISQCVTGFVEMSRYSNGYQLKETGVLSGYDSTVEAAVAKLMFLHAKYDDIDTVRRLMNESLVGEISIPY